MKIELHRLPIREVLAEFTDTAEEGVTAFHGKLNIRPKYQREFVYKDKQRDAVLDTVKSGFPLNVMYWMVRDDGGFEVLDGQQRTISIGQYVNGDFSLSNRFFHNLTKEEQANILDYELMIYFCEGTDRERLDWFRTINIAGEKLTEQEIRNAVYTGPWLSDAKSKFSKSNCAAYLLASDGGQLLTGSPIRQDYLETCLSWINGGEIEDYMAKHQHDVDSLELWNYFRAVILWVRENFTVYRREMAGVAWGPLYNKFKEKKLNPSVFEQKIADLMQDEEVTKKSGIYEYVLTNNVRALNIRSFTDKMKREVYEKQKGICPKCSKTFSIEMMEADHIKLWSEGGKTIPDNCQMLCIDDHREKSSR